MASKTAGKIVTACGMFAGCTIRPNMLVKLLSSGMAFDNIPADDPDLEHEKLFVAQPTWPCQVK